MNQLICCAIIHFNFHTNEIMMNFPCESIYPSIHPSIRPRFFININFGCAQKKKKTQPEQHTDSRHHIDET